MALHFNKSQFLKQSLLIVGFQIRDLMISILLLLRRHPNLKQLQLIIAMYRIVSRRRQINMSFCTIMNRCKMTSLTERESLSLID
jgi:hypothetical protein